VKLTQGADRGDQHEWHHDHLDLEQHRDRAPSRIGEYAEAGAA
jgi:hypothetical protein